MDNESKAEIERLKKQVGALRELLLDAKRYIPADRKLLSDINAHLQSTEADSPKVWGRDE